MADGVGIDIEELDALARFGGRAERLARRWLDAAEQTWCRRQGRPGNALVVIWSCREAAFKATGGARSPHDIRLKPVGTPERGHARAYLRGRQAADVGWRTAGGRIVAIAAGRAHAESGLLDRLLSLAFQEDLDADTGNRRYGVHRHGPGASPA